MSRGDPISKLLQAVLNLAVAVVEVASATGLILWPFIPMLAWAAFWYFAVDWHRLRPMLARGGVVPVLGLSGLLVAVAVAIDPQATRTFGPVTVSSVVHKIGWVAALLTVATLAGAARVSRGDRLKLRVHD